MRGRTQLPMDQVTNAHPRAMPRALLVVISEMMAIGLWKRGIMVAFVMSYNLESLSSAHDGKL